MSVFRRFLALLLLLLFLIFAGANTQPVTLHFPGWRGMELPLFLPIFGAFFAGVVLALLGQSLYSMGKRIGDRRPKGNNKKQEKAEPSAEPVAAEPEPEQVPETSAESESAEGENH